jgi:negative regulator of sigma E activity
MDASANSRPGTALFAPVAITAAILAAGLVGVYSVSGQGASLFVAMIENGMAWCF